MAVESKRREGKIAMFEDKIEIMVISAVPN